ncbi:ABC transporter [Gemmobacter aquatilis]|uniref:ABC transporter n=1 Tax=Gemmobacter aquatilis TaxID=933059 RepID=A0A1H8CG15_9RHOB|nr:ATP-binding cassette domain-containing protein [Gemmobacter aquatilis]SEM93956.1 ABC transporter [Gemmobacter aquatilis]
MPPAASPPKPPRQTPPGPAPRHRRAAGAARPQPAERPDGAGRPLFAPVNARLQPGDWLALVAPSGHGKSTLLLALAGLVLAQSGQILLQGHPLADWPEGALRGTVTLVPQRPALIGGSVADNLALAAPEATPATMQAALEAVALWPALLGRGGLGCPLGAGGAGLSGGEARRLALARALLRRPALLLLDEPTEGFDAATARAVLHGIASALPDTAVLLASHRAADAMGAGQILTLRRTG